MAVANQAPPSPPTIGYASIIASSGAINTGETVIVQTSPLSANRLSVGSTVRATLFGTCTSSATNVSTFNLYIGTAGTTGDTKVLTAATGAAAASGTSIVFKAVLEMVMQTVGSAASVVGTLTLYNAGATGISTVLTQVITATPATFNSTVEANIVSVSYLAAATTTTSTFTQAYIESLLR